MVDDGLAGRAGPELGTALGFNAALPVFGYDEKHHRAGYFYPNSFKRDQDAWALARSDEPFTMQMVDSLRSDQYGGLLAASTVVYSVFGGTQHRPLMVVTLVAFVSAMGILYAWGFARSVFSDGAGLVTAWVYALYPKRSSWPPRRCASPSLPHPWR